MSAVLIESGSKKRKNETCQTVLNICGPLLDVARDRSFFLPAHVTRGDGSSDERYNEICLNKIESFAGCFARQMFPAQKENLSRWKDVCRRFSNLILLSIEVPEIMLVLEENWVIACKTLCFSANWFFASTNICRMFPFKIYEHLLLLSEVPSNSKALDPARVPYRMSEAARKSVILFVLRTSFLICRVNHRTASLSSTQYPTVLDPDDFHLKKNDGIWTAADMKERVRTTSDALESFHESVHRWCVRVLKSKIERLLRAEVGSGGLSSRAVARKSRALAPSEHANPADFNEPTSLDGLQILLTEIGDSLRPGLQKFRSDKDEVHRDLFLHNDLVAILKEVICCFKASFLTPEVGNDDGRIAGWSCDILCSSIAHSILYPEHARLEKTLIEIDDENTPGTNSDDDANCFASPLILCAPESSSRWNLLYAPIWSLGFAVSMAVLDSARYVDADAALAPSGNFRTRDRAVWKFTGREVSVYTRLRSGDLKDVTTYRMMFEVMILQEYCSSMFSNADTLLQRSNIYVECLLLRADGVEGVDRRFFEHAIRPDILHSSIEDLAEDITPLSLLFAVTCQCRGSYKLPFRVADGIALQIEIPEGNVRTRRETKVGSSSLYFGGSVGVVSDIDPSAGRGDTNSSMNKFPLKYYRLASHWHSQQVREGHTCKHRGLIVQAFGAMTKKSCDSLESFAGNRKRLSQGIEFEIEAQSTPVFLRQRSAPVRPPVCSVAMLFSGVTTERCLKAASAPEVNPALLPLLLSLSPEKGSVDELSRKNNTFLSRNAHSILVLGCQVLLTLGRINLSQWFVIYEILRRTSAGNAHKNVCALIVHGPPGTGKTTTIAKLLALLYHDTPDYCVPSLAGKERLPSFRTLICAPSNAAIDHILSRLHSEGVFHLNFQGVSGYERCTGSQFFEKAMKRLLGKIEKGDIEYSSIFRSKQLRPPCEEIQSLDAEYSDLRVVRVGSTEHPDARLFLLTRWIGISEVNEDVQTTGGDRVEQDAQRSQTQRKNSAHAIRNCDIVLCTCSAAGSEAMADGGNFNLIIIDEAAQATEPELLIPLSKYVEPTTVVAIIGDPKQLGPTILSQDPTVRSILGTSFMKRTSEDTNPNITSLLLNKQYRMHSRIAEFISDNFYGGALASDPNLSRSSVKFMHSDISAVCVNTSLFCPYTGPGGTQNCLQEKLRVQRQQHAFVESRTGSSYSNFGESILVARIVQRLIRENPSLSAGDIAVITPYAAQKRFITDCLLDLEMSCRDIAVVDTIDAFQGKESSVVIIDLVRSAAGGIGFIGDEQRANVAISRAKKAAIVIGNFATMKENSPNPWEKWFDHCQRLVPSGLIHSVDELADLWGVPKGPLPDASSGKRSRKSAVN